MSERVSSDEIRELMLRVADGSAKVTQPEGAISWDEMYAGDVEFLVDGWTVVVFNDCDEWDYVDHVVAPDGREGEFDDWPDDARNFGLKGEVYERMKAAFTGKTVL